MNIIKTIAQAVGPKLAAVILVIAKCIMAVVQHLEHRREDKKEKQKKEDKKNNDKKIDDVCDNGNIEDLLNL